MPSSAFKKLLTQLGMTALNWDLRLFSADITGPFVYLYVWDAVTQWTWACSANQAEFIKLSQTAASKPNEFGLIRDALGQLISKAKAAPNAFDEDTLGLLLTLYAGTTQVLQKAEYLKAGGHFIVLNYPQASEDSGTLLRPFVVPHRFQGLLPAEDLSTAIQQVFTMDRQRHPEWFIHPGAAKSGRTA